MRPSREDAFGKAREEKRVIFRENWNRFISGKPFLTAVIVLALTQLLFFFLSGSSVAYFVAILGTFSGKTHLLLTFGVQVLLSLPGFLNCVGLLLIRRKAQWQPEPNLIGIRLLRWVNFGVILITGAALALYPTIIIGASEYYTQETIYRIFYVILCSTLLLLLSVFLLRPMLRMAEENVACCWSERRFELPLIFIFLVIVLIMLIYAPLRHLIFPGAILLLLAYALVLWLYWHFLKQVSDAQQIVDDGVISSMENPEDPYNRY